MVRVVEYLVFGLFCADGAQPRRPTVEIREMAIHVLIFKVGGQAVLGRQSLVSTPWLTERHGYDPTCEIRRVIILVHGSSGRIFCIWVILC